MGPSNAVGDSALGVNLDVECDFAAGMGDLFEFSLVTQLCSVKFVAAQRLNSAAPLGVRWNEWLGVLPPDKYLVGNLSQLI